MSRYCILVVTLLLGVSFGFCSAKQENHTRDTVWPGDSWITAEPEEVDMSSTILSSMLETIHDNDYPIDSVHVVRYGYLVLEAYRYPFEKGRLHIIHSCTKSIVSTLIGLLIDEGALKGVGDKVLPIFPEVVIARPDAARDKLKVEHVLTMTTGLDARDSYLYRWKGLSEMRRSDDWVDYALNLPVASDPGTTFDYSNTASFLLSAIVQKQTGRSAGEYAKDRIFDPIGIGTVMWPRNPAGINHGWGDLRMLPGDLARFGLLILSGGEWDGTPVVPTAWVREATKRRVTANTLRPFYGYQWWIDPSGPFMALGYRGQYLIIDSELDLVAVFTSTLPDNQFNLPWTLYTRYVKESVGKTGGDAAVLRSPINDLAAGPDPTPVTTSLSAEMVNGIEYAFGDNPFGMSGLTLFFEGDQAIVREHYEDTMLDHRIGLNGRYKFTDFEDQGTVAVRGRWLRGETFEIEYYSIGGAWSTEMEIDFVDDGMNIRAKSGSGSTIRFSGTRVTGW